MARLGRGRRAEAREHQQRRGGEDNGADENRASRPRARQSVSAEAGERDHACDGEAVAGDEVPGGLREIAQDVERGAEATAASPTPTSKRPARTRSVRQNGMPSTSTTANDHAASRTRSLAAASSTAWAASTRAPYGCAATQSSVAAIHAAQRPSAGLRRRLERQKREQAREEEEAVHPSVDAVEEQHPAGGAENRGDDRRGLSAKRAASTARSGRLATAKKADTRAAPPVRRRDARRPRRRGSGAVRHLAG